MRLNSFSCFRALVLGLVVCSTNNFAQAEETKVEVKQSTPEEAYETYKLALQHGDYEAFFKVTDEANQLSETRALIMSLAILGLNKTKKDPKYREALAGLQQAYKDFGLRDLTEYIDKQYKPTPEDEKAIEAISDKVACCNKMYSYLNYHKVFRELIAKNKTFKIEKKELVGPYAVLLVTVKNQRNADLQKRYGLEQTPQGWILSVKALQEANKLTATTKPPAGDTTPQPREVNAVTTSIGGIRLKHTFSAIEKQPKEKHGIEITALSFSPDSRRVAVSAVGQPIQVWDLEKPERILSIPLPKSEFPLHTEVAWSPDGKLLAIAINAGDTSESFGLYSIQDKRVVNPLPKQKSKVCDIQWVGADRLFFGVSDWTDSHVQFGKAPPWKPQYNTVLKGHGISNAAISPDGTLAAASTGEAAVLLGSDGKETAKLPAGEGNEIIQFAFSPTGKQLAIGRRDKLELYDTTEKTSKVLLPKTESWVKSLAFTPDAAKLIVLTRKILILDPTSGKVLAEQKASGSIAALSPSGKVLITGSDDLNGEVSIWELEIEVGPSLLPAVAIAPVAEATKPGTKTPVASQPRTWTSADGMFKIEAEFVQQKQGFVQLKRKDNGALVSIQIEKLSDEDQELLKTLP